MMRFARRGLRHGTAHCAAVRMARVCLIWGCLVQIWGQAVTTTTDEWNLLLRRRWIAWCGFCSALRSATARASWSDLPYCPVDGNALCLKRMRREILDRKKGAQLPAALLAVHFLSIGCCGCSTFDPLSAGSEVAVNTTSPAGTAVSSLHSFPAADRSGCDASRGVVS